MAGGGAYPCGATVRGRRHPRRTGSATPCGEGPTVWVGEKGGEPPVLVPVPQPLRKGGNPRSAYRCPGTVKADVVVVGGGRGRCGARRLPSHRGGPLRRWQARPRGGRGRGRACRSTRCGGGEESRSRDAWSRRCGPQGWPLHRTTCAQGERGARERELRSRGHGGRGCALRVAWEGVSQPKKDTGGVA